MKGKNHSLLLVANWDSSTEYAWWLMESFWLLLGKRYTDLGSEVYLVYPSISTLRPAIAKSSIKVKELDLGKSDLASLFKQYRFLVKHNIGTVYLSDYPDCSLKYIIYRLAGVRFVLVHEHTPGTRSKPGKFKLAVKKLMHRIPYICANGLIAATDYIKHRQTEINGMPEEKCYCAANGLPTPSAVQKLDLHKMLGIPDRRKIMVTTGRATYYKGIDFALAVTQHLVKKKERKDIHYLFCGDGPDLDKFREIVKTMDIENHVTFTGYVDNVFAYLLSCDLAIHPSQGEVGYSLSILEYMQAALPVVVPDNPSVCGATSEGVNGFIYREGDVVDAADKVSALLSSPEITCKMGANAKHLVSEKYKLSDTHEQLLSAVAAITST